jgi:hypothetical protein
MFEELIRTLKQFEKPQKVNVPISLKSDADGYIDRECPNEKCLFVFKIHENDWNDKVCAEEVFCPFCGHAAPSDSWLTKEQLEYVERASVVTLKGILGDAMERDAKKWNRRQQQGSFLKMTLNVKRGPQEILLPAEATGPMRLKMECPSCNCKYSVIGSAYFCPACGHNSADLVFEQSLDKIGAALDILPSIRAAIDPDTAENTVQLLLENGLQQSVTAFQRFVEALWTHLPNAPKPRRNVFQNLGEGNELWKTARGKTYLDYLSSSELETLDRYFQQRHVLAHLEGFVDESYLTKTKDDAYRLGQHLVVRDTDVRECLSLVKKLGLGLRQDVTP